MEPTDYIIRLATGHDAEALAEVHEATWRETYVGLMSEEMLAAVTSGARAAVWRRVLAGEAGYLQTTYVAEREGRLVAFGSCGPQRDEELAAAGYPGEFTSVYVLKSDQRCGVGTAIMQTLMADLRGRGLGAFTLWVPRDNFPARNLYEQLGGKLIGKREVERGQGRLAEVAYGWAGAPAS